jgi:hypothetical protein
MTTPATIRPEGSFGVHARSEPNRWRLAQETRHPALNRIWSKPGHV